MFVIDHNRELFGYSEWPWDALYTPVVGCFRDGVLETVAVCGLPPQPGPLDGPRSRCWFRMRVVPETRELLQDGDPRAQLARLEDGFAVRSALGGTHPVPAQIRVEDFLAMGSSSHARLDGFTAFLTAPLDHQLDILFLDILNRTIDDEARPHYLHQMDRGMTALEVRDDLLRSDEFRQRRLTNSDRVGALATSPLWRDLRRFEPLGERRQILPAIRLSDYAEMSDRDFAVAIHRHCHGDDPDENGIVALSGWAAERGRAYPARMLVRDAANGGRFVELVED